MELEYTAALKVAAERHVGSNPTIPSDHINPSWCGFESHRKHAGHRGDDRPVYDPVPLQKGRKHSGCAADF